MECLLSSRSDLWYAQQTCIHIAIAFLNIPIHPIICNIIRESRIYTLWYHVMIDPVIRRFQGNSHRPLHSIFSSTTFCITLPFINGNFASKIETQFYSNEKYLGGTFQESVPISPVTKEGINSTISTFGDIASGWHDIALRSIEIVKKIT